jgi:hypothetical protein
MIQLKNKHKRWCTPFLVTGIAVTLSIAPSTLRAQNGNGSQTPSVSASANAQVNIPQDESRNLDQFLSSHPEIARQLQSNPALANDPDYLRANPEFRDYLQQHPQLQTGLRDNAAYLLHQQQQSSAQGDGRGDAGGDRAQANDNANRDQDQQRLDAERDRRSEESARIDQFLADHPNIDKDLKAHPANVNDDGYLKKHAELQMFLRSNPDVRDECGRNPAYFEDRDLRAQMIRTSYSTAGANDFRGDTNGFRPDARDERGAELAQFNRFLDAHPEIAEQLRKDPSLADRHEFVQQHPALATYLENNPAIRDQLSRDPNAFMHQEDRIDRVDDRDRARFDSFRDFMDHHPRIAADVSKDPTVVKDHDYVHKNPELSAYLDGHPDVRDAWSANPQSFVKGAQQSTTTGTTSTNGSGTNGAGTVGASSHAGATGSSAPSTGSTSNPTNSSWSNSSGAAAKPKQ